MVLVLLKIEDDKLRLESCDAKSVPFFLDFPFSLASFPGEKPVI